MLKIIEIAFVTFLFILSIDQVNAQEVEEVYEGQEEQVEEDRKYRFFGDINKSNFVSDFSSDHASRSIVYSKGYNLRDREGYQLLGKSLPMNIEWGNNQHSANNEAISIGQSNMNGATIQMNGSEPINPKTVVSSEMTSQKSIVGNTATPNNAPRNNDAVPANPDDTSDLPVNSAVYVLVIAGAYLGFKFKRRLMY
jgi:hypothetical protein